ncbi:glycoside hydrolase family 18 protein [Athelia psychrophila]|uniref:Glycoside hydrolase family 18 protein n=1 Tax=Athelia psychrophila TaxID=1759441 RepID=A0A165Z4Z9_9AGAM|nr:glycoside hydrolase family 18 protein [Fibularhizoctonia sp. CBS 109695]
MAKDELEKGTDEAGLGREGPLCRILPHGYMDGVDTSRILRHSTVKNWLITFTTELRLLPPAGQYIISHAPLASMGTRRIPEGCLKRRFSLDFYTVQCYSQGTSEYTDCAGLLTTSSSAWPDTALFQIAASGVSQDKLVIGKPATVADASNGYADPATLATCISTAVSKGWNGGIPVWPWPNAESAGIENVRGTAVPAEEEQQPRLPQAHISHDVDECHLNSFR